jgi:Protein of unknown function (DUF2798)
MEGNARFVFPVVITAIIAFVVTGAGTFFKIGWENDFVIRWWSTFAIGWPIAACTAYLAMPFARSLIQRIVGTVERTVWRRLPSTSAIGSKPSRFDPAAADTLASCGTCTTRKEHEP